jgi:23S rRNA (pseudouridine1915-N3)-methyltransferase
VRICVISFGKLKTPGLRDAADYYKRLARSWLTVDEIELKPLSVPDKSPETRSRIQEKEGQLLLDRLKNELSGRGAIFLLDEMGKPRTTQAWAQELREWEKESLSSIAFCVGSSLGFSSDVRQRSKGFFSLGPQTLSHELARVVLLEQIYRACSVVKGHPYHNEGS